ncbi:MAG: hypothetical protein WBK20_04400 [Spirochaetota bacterium]
MSMHLSVEAYEILEKTLNGKDEAKKFLNALEEAIVNNVHDTWYRTKEELKAEVFSEFATKKDLEQVRIELLGVMEKYRAELLGEMKKQKAELLGEMKKDKAELLGIMKQDKAELLGKMDKDKAELLGIMKQDKAELLGKMDKDKAELLGKIEALYEKTEKDKAELLGIMKQDKAELLLKMEQMNKKFSIYFVTLLFVIIFLNQNALEFIAKVIGLLK